MPRIELGFTSPAIIIILLLLVSVAIAFVFYRFTLPPVSSSKKFFLIGLRALALASLLALLFEPFLRLVFTSVQPPAIAVLIDNSKSMNIADIPGETSPPRSRAEVLAGILRGNALKQLVARADVRYYTFGSRVTHLEALDDDSMRHTEDRTDISAALRSLAPERERSNMHAALLLTDGGYNIGPNPVYEAENLGMPLYAVGIGDTSEQKDIVVTKLVTNDLVFDQTSAPVDVTIKSSGFDNERIVVSLSDGARELDRKTLTLQPGTREYNVLLSYTPEGEGTKKFSVHASPLPGELTTSNNNKSFFAKVLRSKLNTLIIAGSPGSDLSVIRQTLAEENSIGVHSFCQRTARGSPTTFYEGQIPRGVVDSADCIILIGFPTAATPDQTLRTLEAAFTQQAKPLLFIHGKSVDDTKLRSLGGSFLPFVAVNSSPLEQYVFFHPSEAQRINPILALGEGAGLDVWDRLPPIFRTQSTYKAKIEATVLGFPKVQNTVLKEPLLLARNVGKQKSLAMLGYGIWRWRLMSQGSPETQQVLSTFLLNSIRWLTTRDDNRPIKVTTARESFSEGEPVEFIGQVYDANAQPVGNAQLRVITRQGEKTIEAVLKPVGNGLYEGRVEGLSGGDYTFSAFAESEGRQLGEDRGRFSVGELDLEFQDTKMNAPLLRQIASATGAEYFTAHNVDGLAPSTSGLASTILSQPSFVPRPVVRTDEFELWNWRYTLAFIVLLVSVEWFIRKRSGMV